MGAQGLFPRCRGTGQRALQLPDDFPFPWTRAVLDGSTIHATLVFGGGLSPGRWSCHKEPPEARMSAHLQQVAHPDLSDNATFAQGFPHEHFTWAREHAPVYWHEPTAVTPDGEGFWVMSRHEDAMAIMQDPATFSSDKGG